MLSVILFSGLSLGAKAGSLGWGLALKYTTEYHIFLGVSGFWAKINDTEYIESSLRTGFIFQNHPAVVPYTGISAEYYGENYKYFSLGNKKEYTAGAFWGIIFYPFYPKYKNKSLSLEPEITLELKKGKEENLLFFFPGFGFSIYYNINGGK